MDIRILPEAIEWAEKKKVALGHFNISDISAFRAIVRAAKDLEVPVVIGTSEGEAEFVDVDVAAAMVRDARKELGHPIFLNADHFKSLDKIKEAVVAGYDAVIFDAASKSLDENIEATRTAVERVKGIDKDVLVEGELGYIGESSRILDEIPEGVEINKESLPRPDEAKRFVEETGIDLIAPAVGNLHGILKGAKNPALNLDLIREIGKVAGVPMVLHGGSGISDEDFKSAIEAGIRVIHVNTELRVAWREGMEKALEDKSKIAPYKILPVPEKKIYKVVENRLKLFNGML